jgi:membrane-associated protease RseP (regulator of RpoE activity)
VTDTTPELSGAAGRPTDNTRTLVRLVIVVALGVALAAVVHALSVLIVIVALVAMVMLHELGHFTAAKLSGMKVTEYFFGFGPKLWSVRRGETEYGVKAIPAGGYVRIVGMTTLEEVEPTDEPRSYRQGSFRARFAVGVAGSTVHFILALLLLFVMAVGTGVPTSVGTNEVGTVLTVGGHRGPAAAAGIAAGDRIVGIDGRRAPLESVVTAIERHPGQSVPVLVEHNGKIRTVVVRPTTRAAAGLAAGGSAVGSQGFIGVGFLSAVRNIHTGVLHAIPTSLRLFGNVFSTSITGIGHVFSASGLRSFAHQVATASDHSKTSASGNSGQLISIVGAVQIGSQAARNNPAELLYLLVAINVFVGLINLVPMLPLDGGHVSIAIYERIRSRRGRRYHADVRKMMPIAYAFLAFIVAIGLGALYTNIVHPVSLPGG